MAKQKNAALKFMAGNKMSKYQEQFAEYFFLKDIMLESAKQSTFIVVSRSDFDAFGFDLLLSKQNGHGVWENLRIQLKATFQHTRWDVHKSIVSDTAGRIVVIKLSANGDDILPTYYSFNRVHAITALSRSPKVAHESKCEVRLSNGEFTDITKNLLSLFD